MRCLASSTLCPVGAPNLGHHAFAPSVCVTNCTLTVPRQIVVQVWDARHAIHCTEWPPVQL